MEENKMLEKIWSEAQTVEVPEELLPERVKERIEAETKTSGIKHKSAKEAGGRKKFHWHGYGRRVAAAAIVLAASLGAYGVAGSQSLAPRMEQEPAANDTAQAGVDASPNGADVSDGAAGGTDTDGASEAAEVVVKELGDYHLAESYEEVYEMLQTFADTEYTRYGAFAAGAADDAEMTDGVQDLQMEDAASDSSYSSANMMSSVKEEAEAEKQDFSTTNLQVTGVDESDIVKTDGHYIYIATDDQVQIVDASTDVPRQLGSIRPEFSGNMDRIREMYVADGKLILIVQVEDTYELPTAAPEDEDDTYVIDGEDEEHIKYEYIECEDMAYVDVETYTHIHTQVLTYDITSPAGAKLLGMFEQDGSYASSRKIGDQLYLFTDYGMSGFVLYREGEKEASDDEIRLPKIQGQTIPEDCIYLPKDGSSSGVLISAMDVNDPEKATDQKMIFNGGAQMYVTGNAIYLYQISYNSTDNTSRTKLTKFKIGGGRITADCAEAVPGYVDDTFAIHESGDGYLYVLTTSYDSAEPTNQLFVLDEKLKIYGKIEKIAVGETVYAARFIDDIGYFVTYRNMDPLFTVDFSDPANPKLIGELEIPGFSDYLQFWDDEHLIGVGEERKAKDSEFIGIKVSLYDISDPANVTESSKVVIEDAYNASAEYNYKALLADSGKNIVAFLTDDKGEGACVSQRIFTVQDGKLVEEAADKLEGGSEYYGSDSYRNLYIGDKLYLVREGLVIVYDMSDGFARTATLKLT